MVTFQLDVKPVSWLAPQRSSNVYFNPRSVEKKTTMILLRAQYHAELLSCNLQLDFQFFTAIPNYVSKKKQALMLSGQIIPTKMDVTNYVKFYEDCLKGTVIIDDRIVARITAQKLYGLRDKVIIRVVPYAFNS